MKTIILPAASCLLGLLAWVSPAWAGQSNINGPVGSSLFGETVKVLPNGNIVVVDSQFTEPGGPENVGAVYLYGPTGTLISRITGSTASDRIGTGGVTVLANGHFVFISYRWDNGSAVDAGAVTWGSKDTGISGVVSAANSLVGGGLNNFVGDAVTRGQGGITALSNGHYVVTSPSWTLPAVPGGASAVGAVGAVTWCDGNLGRSGLVTPENSLVGSSSSDGVGLGNSGPGVTEVGNSNYVVTSLNWRNGTATQAGAITWCDGSTGRTGPVSPANSLVGSQAGDRVGGNLLAKPVTVLTNGNYVVISSYWKNGTAAVAGAVTWCPGNTLVTGVVSATNSLVGTTANDAIGRMDGTGPSMNGSGVVALSNGHYVVSSPLWDKGTLVNAGAVTWGNGTTGTVGAVTADNSVTGTVASDFVGRVAPLASGNYVISSWMWDSGALTNAGAARLMNGSSAGGGVLSEANALVGTKTNDYVSLSGVIPLTNGNYVVASSRWSKPSLSQVGAVTWVNGSSGLTGPVTEANSLTGSSAGDMVGGSDVFGAGLVVALTNGNYVVATPKWRNGSVLSVGAVTWADGTTGLTGAVTAANSMTGSVAGDLFGGNTVDLKPSITALADGNFVIGSSSVRNGSLANAGAISWSRGDGPLSGTVSGANSLLGSTQNLRFGSVPPTALSNGDYAVPVGLTAVLLGKAGQVLTGPVSTANSSLALFTASVQPAIDYRITPAGTRMYAGWRSDRRVNIFSYSQEDQAELLVKMEDSTTLASGATVAMGEIALTGQKVINLEIANQGFAPLILANPTSDNARFSFGFSGSTIEVPPLSRTLLPLIFASVQAGNAAAVLGFTTNDPLRPAFTIQATASTPVSSATRTFNLLTPPGSEAFGTHVVWLPNGNLVVTDPLHDAPGPVTNVGAAYLFSPSGTMISKLTGSTAGDEVGLCGVTLLANGNYLISSRKWQNNGVYQCGAVTWGSAITGVSGIVSAGNSLVGSNENDDVGGWQQAEKPGRVRALPNGNYVVGSPKWSGDKGAVTWGNGQTGVSGEISAVNSYIGNAGNRLAWFDIHVLPNSNYLISSPGVTAENSPEGGLALGLGDTGLNGLASQSNSIAGMQASAFFNLSDGSVVAVVDAPSVSNWSSVFWMDGVTPLTGIASASQLLTDAGASVGAGGIVDLGGGKFAVLSPGWQQSRGAVTWCQRGVFVSGQISPVNSLVGSRAGNEPTNSGGYGDDVGLAGSVVVGSSMVAVTSSYWSNGTALSAGAVTWSPVASPVTGEISALNSLVGSSAGDRVGFPGVVLLKDGNFVVASSRWNGASVGEGAVTWVPGSTGLTGPVTAGNSLTGGFAGAAVGIGGVTPLSGNRYVVNSYNWNSRGAVTWMAGPTAGQGIVHSGNSLIGPTANDRVGNGGIQALENGHYVVSSPGWSGVRGAATWMDGFRPAAGTVSASNSLVGSTPGDVIGYGQINPPILGKITTLRNGHYLVTSPLWDRGSITNAGAITWCNGQGGTVGAVSSANSTVGNQSGDNLGHFRYAFEQAMPDGSFAVLSENTDNGSLSSAGLFLAGNRTLPATDSPAAISRLPGRASSGGYQMRYDYHLPTREWAVGNSRANLVTLLRFNASAGADAVFELPAGIDLPTGSAIDFGTIAVGSSVEKTLTLINRGSLALDLGSISLAGPDFTLLTQPVPPTVAAGASVSLTLRFAPVSPGLASSVITLNSNAVATPVFTLKLRGSGSPLPGFPFGPIKLPPVITVGLTGNPQINFQTVSGQGYLLERSSDLVSWPLIRQLTADPAGLIQFTEEPPLPPRAYYRLRAMP